MSYTKDEIQNAYAENNWKPMLHPSLLHALENARLMKQGKVTEKEKNITEEELRLAVVRAEKKTLYKFPAGLAGMILDEVRAMRDPYPPDSTWKDANGTVWQKSGEGHWVRPGFSERFAQWALKTPLKRMVTDDEPPF
jgi:hypothetical protein